MNWDQGIGTSIGFLLVLSIWCLNRVHQEVGRKRSMLTAVAIWGAYLLHLMILVAVSIEPLWVLPIPPLPSFVLGGLLMMFGVLLAAWGMLTFGSLRRVSGDDTSILVTHGVYAWSRNPQNVGWIAAQFGITLLGRSGLGVLMSTVFAVGFLIYVRIEERHLYAVFGEDYISYLQRSHRLFGPPKSGQKGLRASCTKSDPIALGASPIIPRKDSPIPMDPSCR